MSLWIGYTENRRSGVGECRFVFRNDVITLLLPYKGRHMVPLAIDMVEDTICDCRWIKKIDPVADLNHMMSEYAQESVLSVCEGDGRS